MGNVVQLWNARGDQRLRRYWIWFKDRIVIGGEFPQQAGMLTLLPAGADGLRVRLQVRGGEFEQTIARGNDIAVWINGLELFVGVKAVADECVLVAFGVARGAKVSVTLEAGIALQTQALAAASEDAGESRKAHGCSSGLCQSRS